MAVGRPREFDPEDVLAMAMTLFWEHGYDGVSISDLTSAAGVNRRSLYATFGSKKQLFYEAVNRYLAGPGGFVAAAMAEPTAWDIAYSMVYGAARAYTDPRSPRGCLLVQGALAASQEAGDIRAHLADRRVASVNMLAERFTIAQHDGELPGTDPLVLARFIHVVCQGISIQASSGATRRELSAVADQALKAWPEPPQGSRAR
jgi:AcrR family transcriptional regulator